MRVAKKRSFSAKCFLVPLICAVIYMVFCCFNLKSSIWFDEAYSAYLVRGDFSQIWSLTAADVHPPFFYFLLKIWSLVFGTTDLSMRFMSVFFGALTIITLFFLLKRWFGLKAASISSLLVAVSPMVIRYGQEMRMYTLVFFIIILATLVLDLALEKNKTRYYVLYTFLIALGMWTHYFAALAWIVHVLYITIVRRQNIFSKKWLLTYLGAVVLFMPWIPSFISQVTEVQKGFWISPVSLITPLGFFSQSLLFMNADAVTGWLIPLFLAVVFSAVILSTKVFKNSLSKPQKSHFIFILMLVLLPPSILILLSLPPLSPMFIDRYILYSAVLIWALIGTVISFSFKKFKFKNLILPLVLIISTITTAIVGIINVEYRQPEGYAKDILEEVATLAKPGEPILVNDEWTYYDTIFYSSETHPIYCLNSWISYQYGSMFPIREYHYNVIDNIKDIPGNNTKFWYITDLEDDISGYDFPAELKDYAVISEVSTQSHIAFELEKLSR